MTDTNKSILDLMYANITRARNHQPQQPVFYVSVGSMKAHARKNNPELADHWETLSDDELDVEIDGYIRKLFGDVAIKKVRYQA